MKLVFGILVSSILVGGLIYFLMKKGWLWLKYSKNHIKNRIKNNFLRTFGFFALMLMGVSYVLILLMGIVVNDTVQTRAGLGAGILAGALAMSGVAYFFMKNKASG